MAPCRAFRAGHRWLIRALAFTGRIPALGQ